MFNELRFIVSEQDVKQGDLLVLAGDVCVYKQCEQHLVVGGITYTEIVTRAEIILYADVVEVYDAEKHDGLKPVYVSKANANAGTLFLVGEIE